MMDRFASSPTSFELQTQLGEERDGGIERFHHDTDVVHPLDGHRCSFEINGRDRRYDEAPAHPEAI
jgi:hypothetical protein